MTLSDAELYPRLDALKRWLIEEIPCRPAARVELEAMGPRQLIDTYLNWCSRLVPQRSRSVAYAARFWTAYAREHKAQILSLAKEIEDNADLTDFLSGRPSRKGFVERRGKSGAAARGMAWRENKNWEWDRDSTLNAYDLHHLHIARGGSAQLVFIRFTRSQARFLHFGSHEDFQSEALGNAVAEDNFTMGMILADIRPPRGGQSWSANEQAALERAGFSTSRVIQGKVVPAATHSSAGTNLRMQYYTSRVLRKIMTYDRHVHEERFTHQFFEGLDEEIPRELTFSWEFRELDLFLIERHSGHARQILEAPI